MSLITRCPACGTMFKVVADQLKISQGWVRCGQCSEVFDAAAHLQPRMPLEAAAPISDPAASLADEAVDVADADAVVSPAALLVAPDATDLREESAPEAPAPAVPISLPEVQVSMPPDLAAEVFVSSVSPEPFGFSEPAPPAPQSDRLFSESEAPAQDAHHDVSFVRDARRDAFWRRPVMRWSLGLATLVLLAALLLQLVLSQRHTLAARQPWLMAPLQALCTYLNCEIRPPQQIESIVIDSSSFSKIGTDAYRLKVVIKNTGAFALAMPSLELTLTDSQDQALLRRVLAPGEFGATAATLAAGAEVAGVLAIEISNPVPTPGASASAASASRPSGPLLIAGYRVLAFYP